MNRLFNIQQANFTKNRVRAGRSHSKTRTSRAQLTAFRRSLIMVIRGRALPSVGLPGRWSERDPASITMGPASGNLPVTWSYTAFHPALPLVHLQLSGPPSAQLPRARLRGVAPHLNDLVQHLLGDRVRHTLFDAPPGFDWFQPLAYAPTSGSFTSAPASLLFRDTDPFGLVHRS